MKSLASDSSRASSIHHAALSGMVHTGIQGKVEARRASSTFFGVTKAPAHRGQGSLVISPQEGTACSADVSLHRPGRCYPNKRKDSPSRRVWRAYSELLAVATLHLNRFYVEGCKIRPPIPIRRAGMLRKNAAA